MSPTRWFRTRFLSALLGVGLLATVCVYVSSPSVALAIPVAGDYVFTFGLQGTFTSDGSILTAWDIEGPSPVSVFSPDSGQVLVNNGLEFKQTNDVGITAGGTLHDTMNIFWADIANPGFDLWRTTRELRQFGSGVVLDSSVVEGSALYQSRSIEAVPEPTSLFLLVFGLGLLALVDYVRRQRRQAGMQVG